MSEAWQPASASHGTIGRAPDGSRQSDAVVWMASLPLDANAQFLTLMATKMPFVGRG